MAEDSTNALGLEFSQLNVDEKRGTDEDKNSDNNEAPESSVEPPPSAAPSTNNRNLKEREKPYVNPERVKTGGNQRDKLSEEALTERMARIREQNEKIKQRRLDVQADEEAFRKTQEAERAKQAQYRKIQSDIDRTRDQNAKRKMDKVQSREWDSGKPSVERHRQAANRLQAQDFNSQSETVGEPVATDPAGTTSLQSNVDSSNNWIRGGPRGRGRGRGAGNRGRGSNRRESGRPAATSESPTMEDNPPSASS
ncbi:hypothetical protein CPB84DRAFT_1770863 [Gymnopilus junonius]|uniref:Uncharacterized protein n=1 Tax=Gymnopilus junonius TaxID=109634 RepID=A0A9P5NVM5_GYMJU|nr:hypothetical protein CPB84DRAFT_1770863 [Gymnopilus junonius]